MRENPDFPVALRDLGGLAADLAPGARVRLVAPDCGEPIALAARDAGDVVEAQEASGHILAAPLYDAGGVHAATLIVTSPQDARTHTTPDALRRIARVASSILPAAADADPTRDALIRVVNMMPTRAIMLDADMRVLAASPLSGPELAPDGGEFVGRRLADLRPDVFERYHFGHARVMQGETLSSARLRWPGADGSETWFRSQLSPWRDASGRIAGAISLAVEITDMVQAVEKSRRSEERLHMAIALADLHVWEKSFDTGEMTVTGDPSAFFDDSLDPAEIAADTNITIHPEDRARIDDVWRHAVENDIPYRAEYRTNRADGLEVWASCQVKLIRDENGVPTSLIGAMNNITERKQAEAALLQAKHDAEAANRAKSAFLAAMSHEIRTPLNGVLGMAQAMAADELSPLQRGRLETIQQSGESLLVILNDVLDLSKIEAGKLEVEDADYDVAEVVGGVRDAFAAIASDKGLALDLEFEEGARGIYRGDAARLRQILSNLVANAVKFTAAGRVGMRIERCGRILTFSVTDTGIGIAADRIERLFNKFEQADLSTTRRFGGTGLGLAISSDLAELMGGRIEAESEEGRGSVFRLVLAQLRVGDETLEAPTHDPDEVFEAPALRILAAEDNPVNQLVVRTLLQQAGVEPVIVDDGAQALEAWRAEPWDVILMDVQMPVMDGPSATRAIRAEEAASGRPRTPIIALTANAMAHQISEYEAAGMDGLIAKPIRVEDLLRTLQRVLDSPDDEQDAATG